MRVYIFADQFRIENLTPASWKPCFNHRAPHRPTKCTNKKAKSYKERGTFIYINVGFWQLYSKNIHAKFWICRAPD